MYICIIGHLRHDYSYVANFPQNKAVHMLCIYVCVYKCVLIRICIYLCRHDYCDVANFPPEQIRPYNCHVSLYVCVYGSIMYVCNTDQVTSDTDLCDVIEVCARNRLCLYTCTYLCVCVCVHNETDVHKNSHAHLYRMFVHL